MKHSNELISLLFPPLVNTGFGNYYPSLAVLSGYLKKHKIEALQVDLNEAFVEHLLKKSILEELTRGNFVEGESLLSQENKSVIAARIIKTHRSKLFDSQGRHAFNELSPGPAYLLKDLADPYHINITIKQLVKRNREEWNLKRWYFSYYEEQGLYAKLKDIPLIGVSIPMGPQLAPTLFLSEFLKSILPDVRIIVGGPSISLLSDSDLKLLLKEAKSIDAAVKYDGERPLLDLVNMIHKGKWAPSEVSGVSCRNDEKIITNKPGKGLNINELPWAHYDNKIVKKLSSPDIGITLTRGCYWGECTYCDFVELYEGSPSFRTRRATEFVDEIEYQQKTHNVQKFTFITEAIPPGFARRFSQLIIERKLELRWSSFAMVDKRFTDAHFELMAKSGCENLVVGVETTVNRVLDLVKKSANKNEIISFITKAHNCGIKLYINLIPDLPTTTYEEAMSALDDFKKIRHLIHGIAIFPFEATLSSEIGRFPEKYGLKTKLLKNTEFDSGQAEFASNHLKIIDDAMSNSQRNKVIKSYRDFAIEIGNISFSLQNDMIKDEYDYVYNKEHLDVLETKDGLQIFNWKLRGAWETSMTMREIIKVLQKKEDLKFTRNEFTSSFGDSFGTEIFTELITKGIIIKYPLQ